MVFMLEKKKKKADGTVIELESISSLHVHLVDAFITYKYVIFIFDSLTFDSLTEWEKIERICVEFTVQELENAVYLAYIMFDLILTISFPQN